MKPYGMNRRLAVPYPDAGDVSKGGYPSKWGRLKPVSKASTRRHQKRAARRAGKDACNNPE